MDQIKDEVVYYYDTHPTEEDLMGEAPIHRELVHYLADCSYALTQNQQVNQPDWRSGLLRLPFST